MPTPSGAVSASDINAELGRATATSLNLNDTQVRRLARVSETSGTSISMSSLQNKTSQWVGWTTVVNTTWDTGGTNYTRLHWYRWYIGDMFLNEPYRYIVIPVTFQALTGGEQNFDYSNTYWTGSGTGDTYPMTNFVQLSRSYANISGGGPAFWGVLAGEVTSGQQYVDFYTSNPGVFNDYSQQYTGYQNRRMNIPEIYVFAGMLPRYYIGSYSPNPTGNPSYTRAARSSSSRYKQVVAGAGVRGYYYANSTTQFSWSPYTFIRAHNYAANHLHIITGQTTTQVYTTNTAGAQGVDQGALTSHYWEFNSV